MTVYPAISLHQPFATLIATPMPCTCSPGGGHWVTCPSGGIDPTMVKRFETRSRPCPPKYIGQRVAIHAAKRRPEHYWPESLRLPWSMWRDEYGDRWLQHYGNEQATGSYAEWPLPLGAVVATAVITASLPIVDGTTWLDMRAQRVERLDDGLYVRGGFHGVQVGRGVVDISDQLPYGDWTPGRFAWALADVVPLEVPVPWKGKQGWFTVDLP